MCYVEYVEGREMVRVLFIYQRKIKGRRIDLKDTKQSISSYQRNNKQTRAEKFFREGVLNINTIYINNYNN